jgi:putative tricarboxylic transport membrane protein
MKWIELIVLSAFVVASAPSAAAQGWSPQKNVEIVAPSPPGGSNDKTARTLERVIGATKLVTSTLTVMNKPGGNATIAHTYVAQRPGDPHYLLIMSSGFLTNQIVGASTLTASDFTPIASLLEDYTVFVVTANSPIKTGKELVARLKKDPKSISIGFANAFGSSRHIAAGMLMKTIGGNPRDLKVVVFKGSAEAIPALLGGHIDLGVIGAVNVVPHVSGGKMRVVGVAAPQRLTGPLADGPTWREQGVEVSYGNWRGVFAPKNLTPAQVSFWENVLAKATKLPEWKEDLEKNYWTEQFVTGSELHKLLDQEYVETKAVLVDLGLAK